jgi:hypothetical protein
MKAHAHDSQHLPYIGVEFDPRDVSTAATMVCGARCSSGRHRAILAAWHLPVARRDLVGLPAPDALLVCALSLVLRLSGAHPEPDRIARSQGDPVAEGSGAPGGAMGAWDQPMLPFDVVGTMRLVPYDSPPPVSPR